jgi:hypothetical protein
LDRRRLVLVVLGGVLVFVFVFGELDYVFVIFEWRREQLGLRRL